MGNSKLKSRHLEKLGFPKGTIAGLALQIVNKHYKRLPRQEQVDLLQKVAENPEDFLSHEFFGVLAEKIVPEEAPEPVRISKSEMLPNHRPYKTWGIEGIDEVTVEQMETALRVPVAVAGALMPDAHKGYGVPVGSVLATKDAVIPYAVGMDIGCRMCLSVYPTKGEQLQHLHRSLVDILKENSRFGADAFDDPMDDEVLDRKEFDEIPIVRNLKDRAWRQIGSSGSGNHFVEFGIVEIPEGDTTTGLTAGEYIGLLTHSGSRGLGAGIGQWYSQVARQQLKLPREARNLSWLDLHSEEGMEYWLAMNLAGDYASACHRHIHERMERATGFETVFRVENHHNFAWKHTLPNGEEVILHRKGATPAAEGELGIIPGSMTAPGFVVKGKGNAGALGSASHGAGRVLSRKRAQNSVTKYAMRKLLKAERVTLVGGKVEEAPFVYKDIHQVMVAQTDLVDVVAKFSPKIVRMEK